MRKIKIAIIAHNCRTGGGLIGTLNLLKGLRNVTEAEQVLLVCSAGYGYEEIELPASSKIFIYRGGHSYIARTWFERVALPKIVGRYDPDVIFGAANIGLTKPSAPQVLFIQQAYLVYDEKHYPDTHLRLKLRIAALKSQIKASLPKTNLILCQTPIIKRRFSEEFSYPENQINILRWPTPAEMRPAGGSGLPPVFDGSSGNFYILLLTPYMAHRNPSVLVPLCKRYGRQIREKGIKFITTVDVQDHPHAGRFLREVSKSALGDIVINVGCLSREDVLGYYSHSDALWLPTMLETLGLPFLEAMRMGLPILAPDIDFARYVCGDAAVFYNPWEIESIYTKIILMREDASLRQELIKKGKVVLCDRTRFAEDWNEVAVNVIRELRSAMNQG